jgi:nucleoside-diphosphate-sugar epimerase
VNKQRKEDSGPTVVVRPTLIYGGSRNTNVNKIKRLARIFRLTPDIKFAHGLRSPIHCDDLAQWMTAIVTRGLDPGDDPFSGVPCVEISGPHAVSFRDLVCYAADASGATDAYLTLSQTSVRLFLRLFGWLPVFREVPRDFVSRLERDFLFPNDNAMSLQASKMRRYYP